MARIEYNTFENLEYCERKEGMQLKDILLNISFKDLSIDIVAFMVSRVVLFTNLLPLSIAYFASSLSSKANRIWLLLFSTVGIISAKQDVSVIKYLIIFILILLMVSYLEKKGYKQTKIGQAIIAMVSTFLAGIFFLVLKNFAGYYLVVAILESIFVFTTTYIYSSGIFSLRGHLKRTVLSTEEIISLILLFGTSIAGLIDFSINGVYFREVISMMIILIFGFVGGPSLGAAIGLIVGLILTLIGVTPAIFIGIFGLSGMVASLFKDIGRLGTSMGFLLSYIIFDFYFQGELLDFIFIKPVIVAIVLFITLPKSCILYIKSFVSFEPEMGQELYYKRIRDITAQQLKSFSDAFFKLSKTFSYLSKKKKNLNQKDVSRLIDDVASKVCSDCGLCLHCWESDFYNTYQTVFSILSAAERKPQIDLKDIPREFLDKCIKAEEFIDTTNRMFELYKLNLLWHNRIVESRELVCEQLKGVSTIIDSLATEIYGKIYFKEDLEKILRVELDKEKVVVSDIAVIQNKNRKYEVTIKHFPCNGRRLCHKKIVPVVSHLLKRKMKLAFSGCNAIGKKDECIIKLVEEEKFKILTGVAKEKKNSAVISGDSYSFMKLKDEQFLLALSDGMGSGSRASEESCAAIELLEDFMETGFDKDIAIKMINSVLLLKSNEESFSTLDMAIIDLYSGIAEFIKIGAVSSFLKRDDEVEIIGSSSLPVGILNHVDIDTSKKKLKSGDIIIMVTDGVLDSQKEVLEREKWLSQVIAGINNKNPQYIADYILDIAKNQSKDKIQDDMTVLVARIWDKSL
ncbi:MAG: stage II sporulation protein E [Epulopiscium sp.]|nr:stage II sporulation protein E [Candidatus Epulonipiscium sp.]